MTGRSSRNDRIIAHLSRLVPAAALIADESGRRAYAMGGYQRARDMPLAVVLPDTAEQVQAVLRYCHEAGVPVVPRGAGTNLAGGTTCVADCVLIATSRMRRIRDFDAVNGTVRVEAGVRNLAVSDHVRDEGWFYAPDPSSRRNCTIGGNIATNSGGGSCLRHGVTVNNIAGLTLFLPNGDRVETGGEGFESDILDLTGLICGSEGQLGVVTEAVLRLTPAPLASWSALLAFTTASEALSVPSGILAKGIVPRQMDFMDGAAVKLCEAFAPSGYPTSAGGMLLLQLDGSPDELRAQWEAIQRLAAGATHRKLECSAAAALWHGRAKIYGAAARNGSHIGLDCSVPLSRLTDILETIGRQSEARGLKSATALHAGDGTVHAYLFQDGDQGGDADQAHACFERICLACIEMGGSISSEYGIGRRYRDLLEQQFSPDDLAVQMRVGNALRTGVTPNPTRVLSDFGVAAE